MDEHDRLDTLDRRPPTRRNLLLLGLWMRSATAGAAFAVAGLASLIDPPQGAPFLTALTWVGAGGTFAWLAWQRAFALLDRIDTDEQTKSGGDAAPSKRPIARLPASS